MKVSVFGAGYVGLVTAACLAEMGNHVVCVDVDAARVARLQIGEVPIFEPDLEHYLQSSLGAGRLEFTTDAAHAVGHGDLLAIAVGTPPNSDGSADTRAVLSVAATIGAMMVTDKVVFTKSTVPVGCGDRIEELIQSALSARGAECGVEVFSNPEFLKEGAAVSDFMKPDRIIIGGESGKGAELLEALYAPFNRMRDKIQHMSRRSAELTKYASNLFLASKISVMNELANLAERVDADIESVRQGVGADPRIGPQFIYAGAGYGGSCFPKDVRALAHLAGEVAFDALLIPDVERVNERQKQRTFEILQSHYAELQGKTFALWGLAFKPNTDDMREAPSLCLVKSLLEAGAAVRAHDPQALDNARRLVGGCRGVSFHSDQYEALKGADALVIMTEWNAYRTPDWLRLRESLADGVLVDGRNLYDLDQPAVHGLTYYSVGRAVPKKNRPYQFRYDEIAAVETAREMAI